MTELPQLVDFIVRHRRVLVLTGAGISTASSIPAYRDNDGVRHGNAPIQGPDFRAQDAVRRRYWARSIVGYPRLARAEPNAGHRALAQLGSAGHLHGLITQNVDGLHRQAGSFGALELHGNIHRVVCLDCRAMFARAFVQGQLVDANPDVAGIAAQAAPDGDAHLDPASLADFKLPWCTECGGMLKPDVVFFGDGVPAQSTAQALLQMDAADALLVIGSSLMVFSGFRFCRLAAQAGKPIAAINLGKTRADDLLCLKVAHGAEHVLPALLDRLN